MPLRRFVPGSPSSRRRPHILPDELEPFLPTASDASSLFCDFLANANISPKLFACRERLFRARRTDLPSLGLPFRGSEFHREDKISDEYLPPPKIPILPGRHRIPGPMNLWTKNSPDSRRALSFSSPFGGSPPLSMRQVLGHPLQARLDRCFPPDFSNSLFPQHALPPS